MICSYLNFVWSNTVFKELMQILLWQQNSHDNPVSSVCLHLLIIHMYLIFMSLNGGAHVVVFLIKSCQASIWQITDKRPQKESVKMLLNT